MADKTLTLGTLFTANPKQVLTAIKQIQTAMAGYVKIAQQATEATKKTSKSFLSAGTELSDYQKATGVATVETAKYQKALSTLAATHGKTGTAFKEQKKALNAAEGAIQRHAASLRTNTSLGDKAVAVGNRFAAQTDRVAVMQRKAAGSLEYTNTGLKKITKESKGATTAMTKASDETKKLGKEQQWMGKQISKVEGGINRLKAAMKVTASYGLAAAAIFSVVRAMQVGVKEIVNYDQALKNLQAITRATDAEIMAMSETLKDVARTTKFSTTEVADGMVLLGQAGFDAGESMDAMQAVANLATGTLGSMQLVTDLLTTSIRAFNLKAVESGRVADVMANAINKSKLTIDKLRIAFGFVGAIASQTGLSIEETAASMMVLANNGLRASTIGTGLRQVLSRLISPSAKLREAFEAHNIALEKVNPTVVGYQDVLKNLSMILWDSEKRTVDMSKAFELFGLRGAQAVAILVKSYISGAFADALDKVYEVGTAAEMAAKQQEGLAVKAKNLADRFKLLALALGEAGIGGTMGVFIDILRSLGTALEYLAKTITGQILIQFGLWTGAIWLNITAIKALIGWIGTTGLIKWLKALRAEFILVQSVMVANTATMKLLSMSLKTILLDLKALAIAHPILAFAAAIGAVATALYMFITASDRAVKKAEKQAVEFGRAVVSLEAYRGSLENLHEKMEKGEDVNREYRATLERLIKTHPKLADEVDINKDSYEKLREAIEKLELRAKEEEFKRYEKIIEISSKKLEMAKKAQENLNETVNAFAILADTSGKKVNSSIVSIENLIKADKKLAGMATKLNANIQLYIATLAEQVFQGKKTHEVAEQQINDFVKSKKLSKEFASSLKENLVKALEKMEEDTKKVGTEFRKFLKEQPTEFQKYFAQLDMQRKVDYAAAWKAMQSKIAAYRKSAEALYDIDKKTKVEQLKIQEEIEKGVLAIKKKFDADWAEAQKKRVQKQIEAMTEGQEKIKVALTSFENDYKIFLNSLEGMDSNSFSVSVGLFQEKVEEIIHLAEEEAREKLRIIEASDLTIKQKTDLEVELAKDLKNKKIGYLEEWKKSLESTYQVVLSEMEKYKDKIKAYNDEIMQVEKTMASFRMSIEEELRDIRRKGMSAEAAWYDKKRDAEETLLKAQKEFNKETKEGYEEGMRLAGIAKGKIGELTGAVKDGTKVKISEQKANQIATELYLKLQKMATEAEKDRIDTLEELKGEQEDNAEEYAADLEYLKSRMNEVNEAIDTIKKNPLKIDTEASKKGLESILKGVTTLRDTWENWIPSAKTFKSYYEEHVTKHVTEKKTEAKQTGGLIGGKGSGDIVPAMLEPGEFVIRKKAVEKYGAGLLSMINQLALQSGGMVTKTIGSLIPQIQKMQTGGQVSPFSGVLHTINLNINGESNIVYGEESTINNLVKTMRRNRLVTA